MDVNSPDDVVLRLAASAYLGRYTGTSRVHSESDLRIYLAWCDERHLAPLAVDRPQMELYVRWMQEVRRFKPSTVSRRMAVVTGFYRTCVIDAVLEHSPADYVRRPRVPPMSTTSATNTDTESCSSTAKAAKTPSTPTASRRPRPRPSRRRPAGETDPAQPAKPAHGPALRNLARAAIVRLPRLHPHLLRHTYVTTMLDAGWNRRGRAPARAVDWTNSGQKSFRLSRCAVRGR